MADEDEAFKQLLADQPRMDTVRDTQLYTFGIVSTFMPTAVKAAARKVELDAKAVGVGVPDLDAEAECTADQVAAGSGDA